MGSGFHSRCSLTGSCGDYENKHYYYKSEGLCLRKDPEEKADKMSGSVMPPSLRRVRMVMGRAMEGEGEGDALVRRQSGAQWPGGCSQPGAQRPACAYEAMWACGGPQLGPRTRMMSTCPGHSIGPQWLIVPKPALMPSRLLGLFPVAATPAQGLLQCSIWASPLPSWPSMLALSPLESLFQEKEAKLAAMPRLAPGSRWSPQRESRLFRA